MCRSACSLAYIFFRKKVVPLPKPRGREHGRRGNDVETAQFATRRRMLAKQQQQQQKQQKKKGKRSRAGFSSVVSDSVASGSPGSSSSGAAEGAAVEQLSAEAAAAMLEGAAAGAGVAVGAAYDVLDDTPGAAEATLEDEMAAFEDELVEAKGNVAESKADGDVSSSAAAAVHLDIAPGE